MNLCSDNHEEVCFEGRTCPCCDIINDKDSEISSLKDKIQDLESQIESD